MRATRGQYAHTTSSLDENTITMSDGAAGSDRDMDNNVEMWSGQERARNSEFDISEYLLHYKSQDFGYTQQVDEELRRLLPSYAS